MLSELAVLAEVFFIDFLVYILARYFVHSARMEKELRFLTLQSHQYQNMMETLKQNRRLHHDFRHLLYSIKKLVSLQAWQELESLLNSYTSQFEDTSLPRFCSNAAINTVLAYYFQLGQNDGIVMDWKVDLPDPLPVAELDLISLFGNMVENAIAAARTTADQTPFFSLTVQQEHGSLYIVSTNSFDGKLKRIGNTFLSTKHTGAGLGLYSIETVAKKYGGQMEIHIQDHIFCMDVLLKTGCIHPSTL